MECSYDTEVHTVHTGGIVNYCLVSIKRKVQVMRTIAEIIQVIPKDIPKKSKYKTKLNKTPEWSAENLKSTRNREEMNPSGTLKGPD